MRFLIKLIVFCCIGIILPLISEGQQNINIVKDTTKTNEIPKEDTLFIQSQIKSDQFYDSLLSIASRNRLTETALNLILVNKKPKGKFIGIEDLRNEEYFKLYEGKIIRNIEILKLDVFGPTLSDTSQSSINWMQNLGNKTHVKTRDFIIKNSLLFQEGDTIDPTQLVDNEKLFRQLDYIKDASIQIAELPDEPDKVDILILIKDVYSLGIYYAFSNPYAGTAEIYENNIAGIGHQAITSIYYDTQETTPIGYNFNYQVVNIGNSFIKSSINYKKAFETEKFGVDLTRKFVSYKTKWAGSLSLSQTSTIRNIKKAETTLYNVLLNYSTQDIWLGRAFLIKTANKKYKNRSRLILGFRYSNNTFLKGPEVNERYNFEFHDNQIALFSFALSQKKHYESSLIYGFGKTEDIPIGTLFQVNMGPEKDEFFKRIYGGIKVTKGEYYPKFGYLSFNSELGGHYYDKKIEQGVLKFEGKVISNMHHFNSLKFRNFLGVDYTTGINRFPDEQIYLTTNNIWGLDNYVFYGHQRLSFHTELVAYSDLYLYNFRFLFFGFGDIGFIAPSNVPIFNQHAYTGIGVGFRVRNENLVFKTFQVKLAFYPTITSDINQFKYLISGENYSKHISLDATSPKIIDYN